LADIGTEDAKQRLLEIAESDDREIASYAIKRLERWKEEFHRKAPSQDGLGAVSEAETL
jgi:hypothetical protein